MNENVKFQVVLLNHGKVKIGEKQFYKLEYCFADKEHYLNTDRVKGVVPVQLFISYDLSNKLKLEDVYHTFELHGEMIPDYQKPMNKKFKLLKMVDTQSKNVISVSE